MKKLLLSLFCAAATLVGYAAEEITYQYDWTVGTTTSNKGNTVAENNKFSANAKTVELGDATWTLAITNDSFNKDGSAIESSKGWQFGTGSVNACPMSLTTSSFNDKTITAVKVNSSGASSTNATIEVTVGGQAFGEKQSLTASAAEYVFTGSATGDIVIKYTQTSTKAVYLKSIAVAYTEGGSEEPDVLGEIKVNGKEVAADETVTVEVGSEVVFSSANAEMISYDLVSATNNKISDAAEESSISWTAVVGTYSAKVESLLGDDTKEVNFTLVVTKKAANISYTTTNFTTYTGNTFEAPVLNNPNNLTIAYTCEGDAAEVNATTGEVTIIKVGEATITATFAGDDQYSAATATYTINVLENPVNLKGEWHKVTSVSDIEVGGHYVIAITSGLNTNNSGNKAMSNANKDNNRDAVEITVNEDKSQIVNLPNNVLILTIEKEGDDYLWKSENYLGTDGEISNGYLNAESGNNRLKCNNPQDANLNRRNTSVSIDEDGDATITFVNVANKNVNYTLRFNDATSNGNIFNTYASNSTTNLPVQIYKLIEPATPAHPVVTIGGEPQEANTTMSLTNVEKYTVALSHEDGDNHTIFHKFISTNAEDGGEFVEYNAPIDVNEAGTLYYYAKHNATGATSETKYITFTGVTLSITEIEGSEAAAEWYDLSGRRIAGPQKGIVIKKTGSKVSKLVF